MSEVPLDPDSTQLLEALLRMDTLDHVTHRAGHTLQGYLAHKKQHPPRTLQEDYAEGPMVVLGGGAASYKRGNVVQGYPT
jgi:hypothetical protein